MNIRFQNSKVEETSQSCKALRTTCFVGGVFSPLLSITWYHSSPDMKVSILSSLLFSLFFFVIELLTYKSTFVRKHALYILYAICYVATIATVLYAYSTDFMELHAWTLIFVIFSVILVMNKISHIVIYLSTMLAMTFLVMYLVKEPYIVRENIAVIIIMFCIVGYFHLKSKFDTQQALIKSEEHYRNLVEISPEAIFVHQDGKIIYINPTSAELIGAESMDMIIGMPMLNMIHEDYRKNERERIKKALTGEKQNPIEQKLVLLDGRTIEVESNIIGIWNNGKPAVMSMLTDITERKKTVRKLIEAESRYRSLVESALVGVFLYQDNQIAYINPYLEKLLGYTRDELACMDLSKLFYPEDYPSTNGRPPSILGKKENLIQQYRVLRKDGILLYTETHTTLLTDSKGPAVIGTVLDITQQKRAEEQIKQIAYHDALTGLPNRRSLNDFLQHQLNEYKNSEHKIAIVFIDLDRFKLINDTLGHKYGDMILKEAAERLKDCVRKGDIVTRYGGDEFVIVLNNIDEKTVIQIANQILFNFKEPFHIEIHEIYSSPSIGISFYPDDGCDVETLIKNADTAMYLAKDNGKNNFQFYTACLNQAVSRKMELENALRKALANDEFILYYQPQFQMDSGTLGGVEALIRWKHSTMGLISPMEFIPLAEETGLIIPIGEWVLMTACRQNKAWQEAGFPHIPIAVNVSTRQLQYSDFFKTVCHVLDKTNLAPEYLVIEMTESIMQDTKKTREIINNLRDRGVRVAIDDFGTGYSSISLLQNLQPHFLKIDPSFIRNIVTNHQTCAIVKNIISMAHELDLIIIAEGIEDEHQASVLKQHLCDIGQGYLFSKPVPVHELEEVFNKYVKSPSAL